MSKEIIRFGVLTVSDRCSQKIAEDLSGPLLVSKINAIEGFRVEVVKCVPDEQPNIRSVLLDWCALDNVDVILTTGGSGLAPRDVTPEVTKTVIDKEAPGLVIGMLTASISETHFAMLSRPECGIRDKTLIINLPGSSKGVAKCFEVISPVLRHAVELINDRKRLVEATHKSLNDGCKPCKSKVDVTNIAARPRQSSWPMVSVEESQNIVLKEAVDFSYDEVPLKDALGLVSASDVLSSEPFPPFPASIKDGYAVIAADGAGSRVVIGGSHAGSDPSSVTVRRGQCVRINTGAPIPQGADAVVQVEDTIVMNTDGKDEQVINILEPPKVGQDIRAAGSDIPANSVVLFSGTVLEPPCLGLIATLGKKAITVFKPPKVAVLSTGNEIVPVGQILKPGQIWDSNKVTLTALLKQYNFDCFDGGIAVDEPDELLSKLKGCLARADVVITTGSVSMGDKDYLKQVLVEDLNAHIWFGRVNMKPGKPTTFATVFESGKKKLIFCLPGNPVSATVTFHLYVLPALKCRSGFKSARCPTIKVKVSKDMNLDPRPEFARAVLDFNQPDGVPCAHPTGNQISSRMLSWYEANALLKLPSSSEHTTPIRSGTLVDALIVGKI